MGETVTTVLNRKHPLLVGSIYEEPPGDPVAVIRVIGPNNQIERFTGSRAERDAMIAQWKGERHGAKGTHEGRHARGDR